MSTQINVVKRSFEFTNDEQKVLILAINCQLTDLTQRIRRARELGRLDIVNQLSLRYKSNEYLLDMLYRKTDFKPSGF